MILIFNFPADSADIRRKYQRKSALSAGNFSSEIFHPFPSFFMNEKQFVRNHAFSEKQSLKKESKQRGFFSFIYF
jgi:hypothetical protein